MFSLLPRNFLIMIFASGCFSFSTVEHKNVTAEMRQKWCLEIYCGIGIIANSPFFLTRCNICHTGLTHLFIQKMEACFHNAELASRS